MSFMIITYFGKQFFKITHGDLTIAMNPVSKDSKVLDKPVRFGANIAFVTTNHLDYNGVEQIAHGGTVPFVVSGPGEYEVGGIFIKGAMTETVIEGKKYINTSYSFSVDGIHICFLGACNDAKALAQIKDTLGSPDILFLPIGGGDGLFDPATAEKVAVSFESMIVIPMDYGTDVTKDSLKTYLKEAGAEKVSPIDKLVLKKKDLTGKNGDVVILSVE